MPKDCISGSKGARNWLLIHFSHLPDTVSDGYTALLGKEMWSDNSGDEEEDDSELEHAVVSD